MAMRVCCVTCTQVLRGRAGAGPVARLAVCRAVGKTLQHVEAKTAVPSKIWVDCDAGVDDAHALLCLISASKGHADIIEGLSVVDGNIGVECGLANLRRTLRLAKVSVDVYSGAKEPLLGRVVESDEYFGSDGLGDVPHLHPILELASSPQDDPDAPHAALRLVQRARELRGSLVVVALGPLTNLALASLIDPAFPSLVKELHVMGGAIGKGNVTPHAEFNFYFDAEAADVVLRKFKNLRLYTWDLAQAAVIPWEVWNELAQIQTPQAKFATGIAERAITQYNGRKKAGYVLCDPLCVVGAIHAQSLTLSAPKKGRVVTTGEERGKLLVEDASHDNDGFFHIVESVCQERVIQEFRQTLLDNVAFHQSGAYRESSA